MQLENLTLTVSAVTVLPGGERTNINVKDSGAVSAVTVLPVLYQTGVYAAVNLSV